jgi:hypothetical protein
MQPHWQQLLLPPLITGACLVGAWGANWLVTQIKLERTLPRLTKVYRLLDPLLGEVLGKWSGSQVRFAIELIVALLADSKITAAEVKWAADQIEQRYRPSKGSGVLPHQLAPLSNERIAVNQLIGAVEGGYFGLDDVLGAARAIQTALRG